MRNPVLKSISDIGDRIFMTAAAPFSSAYSAKKRWRQEREEWEALGIAQTEIARKIYVVPRTGAVCITVSKCANTSIKYMLYPPNREIQNAHQQDYLLTRLTDTGLTLNDLVNGEHRVFTFVRHPVSRFWSAYFDKIFKAPQNGHVISNISHYYGIAPRSDYAPEMVLDYVKPEKCLCR